MKNITFRNAIRKDNTRLKTVYCTQSYCMCSQSSYRDYQNIIYQSNVLNGNKVEVKYTLPSVFTTYDLISFKI